MKEACVGQWSLGTLVPVSARVDVSVYGMCLRRRAEKRWEVGGLWKQDRESEESFTLEGVMMTAVYL